MDFADLFRRGWNIVWNNKYMFALGFLAALGAGGGSNFQLPNGTGSSGTTPGANGELPFDPEIFENADQMFAEYIPLVIAAVCFFMILGIVFWFVRNAAQAGLIRAAYDEEFGSGSSFGAAFATGTSLIGSMLGLSIVLSLPALIFGVIFGAVAIMSLAGFAADGNPDQAAAAVMGMMACISPLICLMIFVNIGLTLIKPFAQRGIVLGNLGVIDSVSHGWGILKTYFTDIFVLGLLFTVMGIGFGIVIGIVALPAVLIFMLPAGMSFADSGTLSGGAIAGIVVGFCCIAIAGGFINGVWVAFRSAITTLAYEEFMSRSGAGTDSKEDQYAQPDYQY